MRRRSWSDGYQVLLVAGYAGMVLYAVGHTFLPELLRQVERRGHETSGVAVPLLFCTLGLWGRAWYHLGPLGISAGQLQWWVWRRNPVRWLRRERLRVLGIGALLAGCLAAVGGLAFADSGGGWLAALVVWAALQALLALCLHLQRRDLDGLARGVPSLCAAIGVVLAVGEAWNGRTALAVALGLAPLLAVTRRGTWAVTRHATRPERPRGRPVELTPRWQLHRGARGRWALGAAVTMLDHEVVRVAGQRDAPAGGRPLPAFVYRLRWPANLAGVVSARHLGRVLPAIALVLPLALAVHRMLGVLPALLITTLLELFVTVALVRAAETWRASASLPRTWATAGTRPVLALYLPALVVCALIAVVVTLGMALPLTVTALLAVLPAAVAVRRGTVREGTEAVFLATPAGAMPMHTVNRLAAGPDVGLLVWLVAGWLMTR